ncbi:molybdenum cofactor guanylyltransferase [Alteribacillus sp. YIM 98480]|uniref:molybdenum cofactor guanylyltransferase n=1 Tax=Alteribacillus sp. YIM 98480 TaxID=2606599 RepID=UPI00131DDFC1|nr:molybdenum cofactor guanylyltransferase [Alteribacillus sp. YIM 98480]
MNISGIVLAGGQSSRYGKPKMFEKYNGLSFYEHSIHAFKAGGIDDIAISTNDQLAPFFNNDKAEILVEDKKHQGPLYALFFALLHLAKKNEWVFLLPTDTPFVSSCFIKTMISHAEKADKPYDAFVPVTGSKQQPLHGMYNRQCLPIIEELINKNKKSMYPLIQSITVHSLFYPKDQKDFLNINRKEDWFI